MEEAPFVVFSLTGLRGKHCSLEVTECWRRETALEETKGGKQVISVQTRGSDLFPSQTLFLSADVEIDEPLVLLEQLHWEKYGLPGAMQKGLQEATPNNKKR